MSREPAGPDADSTFVYRMGPDERPSLAVLAAVSTVTGRPSVPDPTAAVAPLGSLYGAIDPDALDALFASATGTDGAVRFEYEGLDVTVTADRRVLVAESPVLSADRV